MAEYELSCFQQRRAQPRIDATAARVQEGGHVAATGALAEADGDAVAGQGGQGFGIDHWPALLLRGKGCRERSLDQGVMLQIGAMGDSDWLGLFPLDWRLQSSCKGSAGWAGGFRGGLALLKGLPGLTTSSIYQDRRDLHP